MDMKVFIIAFLLPAILAVTIDKSDSKSKVLSNSNATHGHAADYKHYEAMLKAQPQMYYDKHPELVSPSVDGQSCEVWRTGLWNLNPPQHSDSEAEEITYIMGIGPPKTASTSTFSILSSNPYMCYFRESTSPDFEESRAIFGGTEKHKEVSTTKLLSHFAPSQCCKASIMKDPSWAYQLNAAYDMKKVFKSNSNVKFVLTIREPTHAMGSFFNYKCEPGRLTYNLQGVCKGGDYFLEQVVQHSKKMADCIEETTSENPSLQGEALADKLTRCNEYFAVQNYDFAATHKRYADQFGSGSIFCQFVSDLKTGATPTRRKMLDFAGLSDIPTEDFLEYTEAPRDYAYTLSQKNIDDLKATYTQYNGEYDEGQLRSMCASTSVSA